LTKQLTLSPFPLARQGTVGYIRVIYWNTWGGRQYRGNCPIWYL